MNLFRPCIDLHDGKVKQIVGSTLTDDETGVRTNFVAEHDSSWYAELYKKRGLRGGHVIKLGSGNDAAAKRALAAWPGGLQVGGGITAENAQEWLDAGASQVIVTSYVFSEGELKSDRLEKLLKVTGREKLVLDLSCRRGEDGCYYIVTDRWQKFTKRKVDAATLRELGEYCSEYLVHAVDVEGKQSGIDRELLGILADGCPVPCVYAGGIGSFADVDAVLEGGRRRIGFTIGSALDIFGGKLMLDDVLARLNETA